MSTLGGLARFTPSVLDKETLEALFVHRESLVEDAVDRVRRAASSKERANRLFVGPRGAGKTHLASLIAHRSRALDGFGERFQLAWLPEDLWAIDTFDDLRKEILKCIEPTEPLADAEAMDGGPRELAGRVAERGPVVVIVENLDQVLHDLGPDGQRKLRAAIESDRSMLLIATATRLTADLLDQDSPFYGFFDTYDLVHFDVDEAADMLKAIARQRGDQALVDELDKPQARARLAAVAHLAGGQPRIWALFGAGLTVEGLDDLVSVLLERFDDLTPYYQEQLRRLSVNQRKAVQALAEADRALPVKALAELTGIDERSLGKSMGELRKAGWVKVKTGPLMELVDKRLTYYELAEPLARLAFQLKAAHGKPVKLVVDFLRIWFGSAALRGIQVGGLVADYVSAAELAIGSDATVLLEMLSTAPRKRSAPLAGPANDLLGELDGALDAFERGDPLPMLQLPAAISDLVESRILTESIATVRFQVLALGLDAVDVGDWPARVEQAYTFRSTADREPLCVLRALWLLREGQVEEATDLLASVRGSWAQGEIGDDAVEAVLVAMNRSMFVEDSDLVVQWMVEVANDAVSVDPDEQDADARIRLGLAASLGMSFVVSTRRDPSTALMASAALAEANAVQNFALGLLILLIAIASRAAVQGEMQPYPDIDGALELLDAGDLEGVVEILSSEVARAEAEGDPEFARSLSKVVAQWRVALAAPNGPTPPLD
jgi:DNA-binding MarR family transcriptional regulator